VAIAIPPEMALEAIPLSAYSSLVQSMKLEIHMVEAA
jgi:hypothetical protein